MGGTDEEIRQAAIEVFGTSGEGWTGKTDSGTTSSTGKGDWSGVTFE